MHPDIAITPLGHLLVENAIPCQFALSGRGVHHPPKQARHVQRLLDLFGREPALAPFGLLDAIVQGNERGYIFLPERARYYRHQPPPGTGRSTWGTKPRL